MKEHGLLLSAPMVRASLRDVDPKWMTRRLVGDRNSVGNFKPSQLDLTRAWVDPGLRGASYLKSYLRPDVAKELGHGPDDIIERLYCRYELGDRIWFRETWAKPFQRPGSSDAEFLYGSDYATGEVPLGIQKWRPSIHMPRAACRIVREITATRPERVQGITHADAIAEGIGPEEMRAANMREDGNPEVAFSWLWDSLNADRSPWGRNDWVWVLSYKRIEAAA